MSKQVISSTKYTKSYKLSNSSHGYNENQPYYNNGIQKSIPQIRIAKTMQKKITGQNPSNFASYQYSESYINTPSGNRASNQTYYMQNNLINNLDSSIGSLQRSSTNAQSMRAHTSRWKTNTNSTYNKTIKTNLTGEEYCTCDDTKEGFNGCTSYTRNTNNTLNKTLSSNDQKIYIQEGNSSDYCNCDEKQIFSLANSEQNVLTDEDLNNMCTCGKDHRKEINKSGKTDEALNTSNTCTCGQDHRNAINKSSKITNKVLYSSNAMISSPLQTTDYEEREINGITDVQKIVNTQINVEVIRKQIREQVRQEIEEEKEQKEEQISWNGDNYIQVIERLQYLAAQPPALKVQYLNDMMINRTINQEPIHVLIPIPDNYIQKQGELEVLSEPKVEEEEKDPNEDLCPENVDLLNISHAYSVPLPSFNNLEIENEEMEILGIPKEPEPEPEPEPEIQPELAVENYNLICEGKEKEPFVIENYNRWDINPSERMWSGDMRPVRVNKLEIEVPAKPNWNDVIERELADRLKVIAQPKEKKPKKPKKEKKPKEVKKVEKPVVEEPVVEEPEPEEEPEEEIEEEAEEEVEEIEEVVEVEDEFEKEERKRRKAERERKKREKELKKRRKDPKKFRKNKFTITYRQHLKRFKTIDIGDNEIITLKAEKRVLEPLEKKPEKIIKQSARTTISLGGKGFNAEKYKWAPVPFNAQSMTIQKSKEQAPLKTISIDRMLMPASRKKRQDWNLVNNLSSQSNVNILTKEKKLCQQKTKTITVKGERPNLNKWNDTIRRQKGIKLVFGPTKKWNLKVNKEIDLLYEQESDDVIINDDYNNVKGPEMRPITATIIKVKEEEDTSSVSSYDVFQNIIVKRTNYELGLSSSTNLLKKYGAYQLGFGSGGNGLLRDRKDLEFGINRIGGGKGSLEFGMAGLGSSSSLLRNKRNLDFGIGGLGITSGLLKERKDLDLGFGGYGLTKGKKNLDFGISNVGLGTGLLKDKNDFGYEFSFRKGVTGSSLLQNKEGYGIGLGMEGGKLGKNTGYRYEYEYSGPSNNRNIIKQTNIITEKSPVIFNGSSANAGISFSKNVTTENYNLTNLPSFGEQNKQNVFKLRVSSNSENEQKNKYDKTVKTLADQTKNLIENVKVNTINTNTMNAAMNSINSNSMGVNNINAVNNMNVATGSLNAMSSTNAAMGSMNAMSNMNAAMSNINTMNNMNAAENMNVRNMNMSMNRNMRDPRNMNIMRDTRNLIIGDKKMKKIEFIREEPEQKNYLKV